MTTPVAQNGRGLSRLGWFVLAAVVVWIGVSLSRDSKLSPKQDGPADGEAATPSTEPARIHVHELGEFEFDSLRPENTPLPESARAWNGREVYVTGFMRPLYARKGNLEYLLVQDAEFYCADHPYQVHHMIHVTLREGMEFTPTMQPSTLHGKLNVGVRREGGKVVSVFRMTPDEVHVHPAESE